MDREKLIQGYIENSLSPEELKQAEKLLATDTLFTEAVKLYKDLKVAVASTEKKDLKNQLKQLEQSTPKQKQTSRLWFIAASIVVILGVSSLFLFSSPSAQDLYAQNFEAYPNTLRPVVRGEVGAHMLPFIAYENKEYDKAIIAFETLLDTTDAPDIRFYYAMSLLNNGNKNEALTQLRNLEGKKTKYTPQIYWYTALLELNNENYSKTKVLLKKLLEDKALYKNRNAKKLLEQLD